jgi:hypothetical protein
MDELIEVTKAMQEIEEQILEVFRSGDAHRYPELREEMLERRRRYDEVASRLFSQ